MAAGYEAIKRGAAKGVTETKSAARAEFSHRKHLLQFFERIMQKHFF